jgi:hypothetical protein
MIGENVMSNERSADPKGISRRALVQSAAVVALGLPAAKSRGQHPMPDPMHLAEETKKEKIRRALLAGPASITREAAVIEMDREGHTTVLRPGTNDWVCMVGNQNIIGWTDMCIDPMGMIWWQDLLARKPKPTNSAPGLIYMLNGATQRSFTDPFDTTSPPIPIGPHWMVIWPFDAKASGLGTVMRDGATMVMFAGTPYAHLHICGSPWDGKEYQPGDRGIWTMQYERP